MRKLLISPILASLYPQKLCLLRSRICIAVLCMVTLCACNDELAYYDGTSLHDTPKDLRAGVDKASAALTRWVGDDAYFLFPVITDIHSTYLKRYKHIGYMAATREVFAYDMFVNLGDLGLDEFFEKDEASELLNNIVSETRRWDGIPAFYCKGNHEYLKHDISQDDLVSALITPFVGMAEGSNLLPEHACGYLDFTAKKIRVFFLNTSDWDEKGYMFSANQLQWLAKSLSSVPAGYDVIILAHFACAPALHTWAKTHAENQNVYFAMLEDFCSRKAGGEICGCSSGCVNDNPYRGERITWDFSAVPADVCLVGNICGDSHFDALTLHGSVWYLTSQGYGGWNESSGPLPANCIRTDFNSETKTLFDIVAVKYRKRQVGVFRVGAGGAVCNRFFTYGPPRSVEKDSL